MMIMSPGPSSPAEVGVVLAEGALVLQVQLGPALRVQRPEHLDQHVLQGLLQHGGDARDPLGGG